MRSYFIIFLLFFTTAFAGTRELPAGKYHNVYYIKKIDQITVDAWYHTYLQDSIRSAEEHKADLIIIELDTPGGSVKEATKIVNLMSSTRADLIVYINQDAISAGAYISLAADFIVIKKGGKIGASTPVFFDKEQGMKKAPEKVVSVLRAGFRSLAEKHGRPVKVCEAMVDEEIELSREKHGYDLPGDKLLTLTAEESLQVKVSEAVVADADQLLQKIDVAGHTVNYIKPRTFHKILKLFSNQIILGLLITLGTLGMIFEIKTAGWGLGGTLAVLALALFFIIQISLGHADWKIPLIFVVGIGLILVEIFIIPGFGIVGLAGILTSIAALFLSFGINNTETALASAAIAVLGITVGTFVLFKYLPDSRIMHKISLNDTNQTKVKSRELKGIKPGSSGIVVSDLRPVGKVKINRHVIEAQSNLGFISAGEKIKVETISGNRVVVNKI